jgi:Arc/MetJ-type ribon-helix-helix transcriptional regulator
MVITVRLTSEEQAALESLLALRRHKSVSDLIRQGLYLLFEQARIKPAAAAAIRDGRRKHPSRTMRTVLSGRDDPIG